MLPLEVFVDGGLAAMGGVADVMAHPAYRRRGYAGELMRAVLRGMRDRGMRLSVLWPFSHAFYRAYGWELAGEAIAYTFKPTDLPTSPEQRHVRAYRDEDLPRVITLFEGWAAGHQLCVRRDEAYWRKILANEEQRTAVYDKGGHVEGYVVYRMSGWHEDRRPRRTLTVDELVAGSRGAGEALVSFMAVQDPLVFEIRYSTPRGEPLHPYLKSSYVEAKVDPEFMLRILNVEGALALLDREIGAPLTLEVADDGIPENAGAFTVAGGEIVRGSEAEARVELDVRQLAQLYAGYLPARQLADHGLLRTSSLEALELLEAYFPVGDPWVSPPDHF